MRAMEPLTVKVSDSQAPVIPHHALERTLGSGGQWIAHWEWGWVGSQVKGKF